MTELDRPLLVGQDKHAFCRQEVENGRVGGRHLHARRAQNTIAHHLPDDIAQADLGGDAMTLHAPLPVQVEEGGLEVDGAEVLAQGAACDQFGE